jgi:hypothetical protein
LEFGIGLQNLYPCFNNEKFLNISKKQRTKHKKRIEDKTILSIVNELSRNEKNRLFFPLFIFLIFHFVPSHGEREKVYEKIWERRKQMVFLLRPTIPAKTIFFCSTDAFESEE